MGQSKLSLRVAEFGQAPGRIGDVAEEDRRQDAVRLDVAAFAGEELAQLAEQGPDVAEPGHVILAGEFDAARTDDALSEVSRMALSLIPISEPKRPY